MLKFIKTANIVVFIAVAPLVGAVAALIYYIYNPDFPVFSKMVFLYTVALAVLLRIVLNGTVRTNRRVAYLIIPLLMFAGWFTMRTMFEDFNVQAIIFHMKYGFTSDGIPKVYSLFSLFCFLGALIIGIALSAGVRQSKIFSKIDVLTVVPLIIVNPLVIETAQGLGLGSAGAQVLPSHYRSVTAPKHNGMSRPNVIHIFLESAERTLVDEGSFGPAMRPILEFENKGLSATNILQVKNTEWTIAGTIAANCGVPLIQPWLTKGNAEQVGARFLPNTTCLGEILQDDGYRTAYMLGADKSFAGTDLFARDHGFMKVEGLYELMDDYPAYRGSWGLDDKAIFEHAEKTVRDLSTKNQPFLVTVTSIGGHAPSGYPSASCLDGTVKIESTVSMGMGLECANAVARNMLNSLEADGLLENTIVIIQSDHLMMGSDFTERLNDLERRNMFMVFGPNIDSKTINRNATMMDVYPTILEVLGYELPEDAAGLGVSLYSKRKNLVETLGEEKLNQAISYDADLRKMLWLDNKSIDDLMTAAH